MKYSILTQTSSGSMGSIMNTVSDWRFIRETNDRFSPHWTTTDLDEALKRAKEIEKNSGCYTSAYVVVVDK